MAHQTFPKPTRRPKPKNRTVTKRRQAKRRKAEAVKRDVYEQVDRRDGYMCVVPFCPSGVLTEMLHHHHIVPRSLGGKHTTENICLVCAAHHAMIHNKEIRLIGNADQRVIVSWR